MAATTEVKGSPPPAEQGPSLATRLLHAHKPGDGTTTRLGLFVALMAFVAFTCHHWYYNWQFLRRFLLERLNSLGGAFLLDWSVQPGAAWVIQVSGTAVLALLGFGFAYYYIYVKPKTAEFLVQTDTELRKVSWTKVKPMFRPDTELWGHTYVVLIVVVLLALFIFGVDFILNFLGQAAFYSKPAQ